MVDYIKAKSLPMDSKIVREISSSPRMRAEQGENFMASYGGSANYIATARMPEDQRVTYIAVQEGYDNTTDIANVTGLTSTRVNRALTDLGKAGLIVEEQQIGEL